MRSIRKLITVCLAVLAAVAVGATPAHAATNWTTYMTDGDVVGVHAAGTLEYHSDGRLYMYGTIKDTKSDGYGACLHITAIYADGGVRKEARCNAVGYGESISVGPAPGGYFSFASNVRELIAEEGLRLKDGTIAWPPEGQTATIWRK